MCVCVPACVKTSQWCKDCVETVWKSVYNAYIPTEFSRLEQHTTAIRVVTSKFTKQARRAVCWSPNHGSDRKADRTTIVQVNIMAFLVFLARAPTGSDYASGVKLFHRGLQLFHRLQMRQTKAAGIRAVGLSLQLQTNVKGSLKTATCHELHPVC